MKRFWPIIIVSFWCTYLAPINSYAQGYSKKWFDSLFQNFQILLAPPPASPAKGNRDEVRKQLGNPTLVRQYALQAIELADQMNMPPLKAMAHKYLGTSYYFERKYTEAANHLNLALDLFRSMGDTLEIAIIHTSLGLTAFNALQPQKALDEYKASLYWHEQSGDSTAIASALMNVAAGHAAIRQYDEAKRVGRQGYNLACRLKDTARMADACFVMHNLSMGNQEYSAAITWLNKSLVFYEAAGMTNRVTDVYLALGTAHKSLGNYSLAAKNYMQALKLSEATGNRNTMAIAQGNLGSIYALLQNFDAALDMYKASIGGRSEDLAPINSALSFEGIGVLYQTQGNYEKAMDAFTQSLKLFEQVGVKYNAALLLGRMGHLSRQQKNYAKAVEYYTKALAITKVVGFQPIDLFSGMGWALAEQAKSADNKARETLVQQAIRYYDSSLVPATGRGYNIAVIKDTYLGLSELYESLNNYRKAYDFYKLYASLKDSLLNEDSVRKLELLRTEFEIDKATREEQSRYETKLAEEKTASRKLLAQKEAEHRLALAEDSIQKLRTLESQQLMHHFALLESRAEKERALEMQRLEAERQMTNETARHWDALERERTQQLINELKAKTLLQQEQALQRRRTRAFILGVALLAVLSVGAYGFIRWQYRQKRKLQQTEDAHKMAELELQSLRAQLNPHFMFNSINAIQDLIINKQNDHSQLYLARFSKLLRMLLDSASQPFVPLQQELQVLDLYLSLEKLRMPNLEYTLNTEDTVSPSETMIPNMSLQPFIENALWQGLASKTGSRKLLVRVYQTPGFLNFDIEDNGIGRKKAAELKNEDQNNNYEKGMQLLKKRFELLSKEYGASINSTITDLEENHVPTGTLVTIAMPLTLCEQAKKAWHDTNDNSG